MALLPIVALPPCWAAWPCTWPGAGPGVGRLAEPGDRTGPHPAPIRADRSGRPSGPPAAIGWAVAIAATSLLEGFIAKQGGSALTTSVSVERALSRLGASGGSAKAYLGLAFLTLAVMVAFVAAGQVGSARAEEAEGRLDDLLVRPVRRSGWLAGRAGVATALVVAGGLLAGLCTWAGAATQSSGVGIVTLLEAGANVVPPSLCILGLGFLALGAWPRAAGAVTYGFLAWSLLIEVVAGARPARATGCSTPRCSTRWPRPRLHRPIGPAPRCSSWWGRPPLSWAPWPWNAGTWPASKATRRVLAPPGTPGAAMVTSRPTLLHVHLHARAASQPCHGPSLGGREPRPRPGARQGPPRATGRAVLGLVRGQPRHHRHRLRGHNRLAGARPLAGDGGCHRRVGAFVPSRRGARGGG